MLLQSLYPSQPARTRMTLQRNNTFTPDSRYGSPFPTPESEWSEHLRQLSRDAKSRPAPVRTAPQAFHVTQTLIYPHPPQRILKKAPSSQELSAPHCLIPPTTTRRPRLLRLHHSMSSIGRSFGLHAHTDVSTKENVAPTREVDVITNPIETPTDPVDATAEKKQTDKRVRFKDLGTDSDYL